MMQFAGLVAPVLLLASSPAAADAIPWPSGIYSNVTSSVRTGDLGGMEARFYEEAGQHMVEFVWCEGWCNQTFKAPVTRIEGGFEFSYFEHYADGGAEAGVKMRFLVQPVGKILKVAAWQGDRKLDYIGRPQSLKRIKQPFGIAVANGGEK